MSLRHLPVLLLAVFVVSAAMAQNRESFDRFFTSSVVRRQLNQAREQYNAVSPVVRESKPDSGEKLLPEIKLKGFIIREDGSSEIWLNNASTLGHDALSNEVKTVTKRLDDETVRITLPDGKQVNLKPGQTYLPDSRKVLEVYQTSVPVSPVVSDAEKTTDAQSQEPEQAAVDEESEFDESELAKTDTRIKLLEKRIQKLEEPRE